MLYNCFCKIVSPAHPFVFCQVHIWNCHYISFLPELTLIIHRYESFTLFHTGLNICTGAIHCGTTHIDCLIHISWGLPCVKYPWLTQPHRAVGGDISGLFIFLKSLSWPSVGAVSEWFRNGLIIRIATGTDAPIYWPIWGWLTDTGLSATMYSLMPVADVKLLHLIYLSLGTCAKSWKHVSGLGVL